MGDGLLDRRLNDSWPSRMKGERRGRTLDQRKLVLCFQYELELDGD